MRILVTGASGLIGSAVVGRLRSLGHEVIAGRRSRAAGGDGATVALDFAKASEDEWVKALDGVEAVVNCAGSLQDGPRDSTAAVHDLGFRRLVAAATRAGVARFIQISALGVDRRPATRFLKTKLAGDAALEASSLGWVILRPSVVVGRAA
jgi:uncharacterized protein YbjT (DUF2867 family)